MSSSVGCLLKSTVETYDFFGKRIPNLCLQMREYEPFSDFVTGLTNSYG